MPPSLARIVFVSFIVAVIIYDNRKEPYPSLGLLVPLVWFLFCGSKSLSLWLGQTPEVNTAFDYASGNPLNRAFLTVLMLLAVLVLIKRHYRFGNLVNDHRWIFYLFLFMGISVLWSDFTIVSAKRWFRSMGDLLMALVIFTEADPFFALQKIIRRTGFILVTLSILFIKYFRDIGIAYSYDGSTMWVGVTTHKNSLGQMACVVALYFTWRLLYFGGKKPVDILFLLMSLWILRGSGSASSKTSIIVYFIGLLVLLFLKNLRKEPGTINKFLVVSLILFLAANMMIEFLENQSLVSLMVTSSGRDMTLTGRTFLWTDLIRIGLSSPILGKGYGGFWIGDLANNLWLRHTWEPQQAHNGYIDVFVNLGLVGLILLIGVLVTSYRKILVNLQVNSATGCFQLTCFTIILLYNITESSFTKPTSFLWILFLMVVVGTPFKRPDEEGGLTDDKNLSNQ